MATKNYSVEITKKELIANDTYKITFKLLTDDEFEFIPGQFITILVAPNVRRSYSIASSPTEKEIVLIGDIDAGGPGSKFFLDSKVGDKTEFLGPLGRFTYKSGENLIGLFATGTGVVPFLSMIEYALRVERSTRGIQLVVGYRNREDMIYDDYLQKLSKEFPNFFYSVNLTKPDAEWIEKELPQGRITESLKQVDFEDFTEWKDAEFYICGAKEMVGDVEAILVEKGISKEKIYFEKYY